MFCYTLYKQYVGNMWQIVKKTERTHSVSTKMYFTCVNNHIISVELSEVVVPVSLSIRHCVCNALGLIRV